MIQNIVFDIGNVLADFKWREYLENFKLSEEMYDLVAGHLFLSPMWEEVDRGTCSDSELLWKICEDVPEDMEKLIRLVFRGAGSSVHQNWYAPKLLEHLKEQGYKIYILSNYGKTFFEERTNTFEFMRYVDGKVISYEIHAVKPEPEIYKTLLNKYHLKAEECLFFDDHQENLDAAEKFGFCTVLVDHGYESIVRGLGQYGIEI